MLVESNQVENFVKNVYLDHDIDDETTQIFLKKQKNAPSAWRHHYLDNIHLIIEAVKLGIGRAVLPAQILSKEPHLKKVEGMRSLNIPVYLIYCKQPSYTKLHQRVIETLSAV